MAGRQRLIMRGSYIFFEKGNDSMSSDQMRPSLGADDDNYYTLVPEQGLCRLGDAVINLRNVVAIRHIDGKTLVYYGGATEPIIFPAKTYSELLEAVFAVDDFDDDDEEEEESEE